MLTTLGVLFGTFVLVVSLSLGQGVQETILREASRYGDLRKVVVTPRWKNEAEVSAKPIKVSGRMSEKRRQRLQELLTRQQEAGHSRTAATPLSPERVRQFEAIPFVRRAVAGGVRRAWIRFNERTQETGLQAALPDNSALRARQFTGEMFTDIAARDVVVTDLLLYQLGVADDADVEKVIGKTLRVDFFDPEPRRLVWLDTNAANEAQLTDQEKQVLDDFTQRAPEALSRLDASPQQRAAWRKLVDHSKKRQGADAFSIELTIRGVVHATEDQPLGFNYYEYLQGGAFVPARLLEDLLAPLGVPGSFDWAILEVDHMDHVMAVSLAVSLMGFQPASLLERIEHERFTYLLIFGGMTIIAGVALLVAALGITNTMLISVLERIREIGVMKAIGAKDRHIQSIFLVEGAVIGLMGGLFGLALAWGASGPCDAWLRSLLARGTTIKLEQSIFVFPLWLLFAAPAFASLVTTLAAVYPARRAARIDPVTALRHE
jgi:putative ABC transport system permease protein